MHLQGRTFGLCLILAVWFVGVGLPQQALAQQVTAAITGKVTDPSDAPIGNAAVTAKDVARGTTWTTETNALGFYNLPRVRSEEHTSELQARLHLVRRLL